MPFKTILFLLLFAASAQAQTSFTVSVNDVLPWEGLYQGTLTYLDYTTNERVTLRLVAECNVGKNDMDLAILIQEWGKRYKQRYKYAFKGGTLNFEGPWRLEQAEIANGVRTYVFFKKGVDGNERKPCTFRLTFSGTADSFRITKDVLFEGEKAFFNRNEYQFERVEKN